MNKILSKGLKIVSMCLIFSLPSVSYSAAPAAISAIGYVINSIANSASNNSTDQNQFNQASMAFNRIFPAKSYYCEFSDHNLPLTLNSTVNGISKNLSVAVRIRDTQNRFVLQKDLPKQLKAFCLDDLSGNIEAIWFLTEAEYKIYLENKNKPKP